MNLVPENPAPKDREPLALTKEQVAVLASMEAFLSHPAIAHQVGPTVLAKIATDQSYSVRERRHAAESLARFQVQALELRARFCGLDAVSAAAGASAVAVARVEQTTRIEIVRETDWRDGGERDVGGG